MVAPAWPKTSVVPDATLMPLLNVLWPLMPMTPPPMSASGVLLGAVSVIAAPMLRPTSSGLSGLAAMLIVGVAFVRFRKPLICGTRKLFVLFVSLIVPETVKIPVAVNTVPPTPFKSPLVLSNTKLVIVLVKPLRSSVPPPLSVTVAPVPIWLFAPSEVVALSESD